MLSQGGLLSWTGTLTPPLTPAAEHLWQSGSPSPIFHLRHMGWLTTDLRDKSCSPPPTMVTGWCKLPLHLASWRD